MGLRKEYCSLWEYHQIVFRKNRFEPSFVEQPKSLVQKLFSYLIKILFQLFGFLAALTGTGYQIIFLYQLKDKNS